MKFLTTSLFAACLALAALCSASSPAEAASGQEIENDVNDTLHKFVDQIGGARPLAKKAVGILVFPSVVKAGFGIGGEYGEGMLIVDQRPAGFYNLVGASFGFQLGVQERSVIIMFMTQDALDQFYSLSGF